MLIQKFQNPIKIKNTKIQIQTKKLVTEPHFGTQADLGQNQLLRYTRVLFRSSQPLAPDLLPARLHSSVGRASHRYREVMGSNPFGASEFFLGFICNCLSYFMTARDTFTFILYPQCSHMIFIICTSCHSQLGHFAVKI